MAVVTPSVDLTVRERGLTTVSTPTRRLAMAATAIGGSAAETLHSADPLEVVDTYTGGMLVELAMFVLNNSVEQVALDLVKVNASVDGYAGDVIVTRSGSSTGTLVVAGAALDDFEVRVRIEEDTADIANGDGEFSISYDGGDTYSNRIAIPTNGIYSPSDTGLTLTFAGDFDEDDLFSFDCVGPGFSTSDLSTALTALDADGYAYQALIVVNTGANAAASAALAATLKTHAEARAAARHWMWTIMQAKHGLKNGTVTKGGTPTATEDITPSGVPAQATFSFKIEITTTGGRGVGAFTWWSDGGVGAGTTGVTIGADGINILGTTGVTVTFGDVSYTDGNEYTWDPTTETDADVKTAFQSVESIRLGVCAGEGEYESGLYQGRKYQRALAFSAALKEAEDLLHHDMGRVRNGVLKGVSSITRDERLTPGLDQAKFITSTTYANKPGKYYITQGNLMSADGSSFDLSQLIKIMNEACRITQVYLNEFPGEDLRTNSDGTIYDSDAEAIDDQLQALLEAGLVVPEHVQRLSAKVRRDIPLSTTRKISATVLMVPKFYVKQAEGDLGYVQELSGVE